MLVAPEAADCPVCGAPSRRLFEVHGHEIRECPACTHQFTALRVDADHVGRVYGDDYFQGGGAGYPDYLAQANLLRAHGRRYGELLTRWMAPGRVLDIGAAAGFVLAGLTDTGWRGSGLEPNDRMARHARDTLGLDVRTGTLEDAGDWFDATAPGDPSHARFDLISMIQVIAHVHDLHGALRQARALTAPDGHWLIETWDNRSLSARWLGRRWHEYSPPSVLHCFSRASLTRLAAAHGMKPVAWGRPAKRITGAHVKSLLGYKFGTGPAGRLGKVLLAALPDRVWLPYPSEDLFWVVMRRAD